MKECSEISGFIAFGDFDELEEWFKKLADNQEEEFNDDLCVEGNSGLTYRRVKNWVNYAGVENVYFEKRGFEHGVLDEFYFDLKNAKHEGWADFSSADEITVENGFLRVWFD